MIEDSVVGLAHVPQQPVGRCKLKRLETRVESAWIKRLIRKHSKPLSSFAFNLNLRRYRPGDTGGDFFDGAAGGAMRVSLASGRSILVVGSHG
jgi:hypothetical protein